MGHRRLERLQSLIFNPAGGDLTRAKPDPRMTYAAEIAAGEMRIACPRARRPYDGVAEGSLRLVLDAVVEARMMSSLKRGVRGWACTTASRSASLYST